MSNHDMTCQVMAVKSSVIQGEVDNLNKLAQYWWDENGPIRPLHTINVLKNKLIQKSLIKTGVLKSEDIDPKAPLKGLKVLDAGCGGGLCAEPMAKLGAEVIGIDPSEEMINLAKHHASEDSTLQNLTYILTTVEEHCEEHPNEYDLIISSEVLEHITEYDSYLEACAKCLKPGGSIIITTFNKTWTARFLGIWMAEYVVNIVPRGTHDYDKFISPQDVTAILEKYGCTSLEVKGLCINPITYTWYPFMSSVHYYLHAVKKK